MTLASMTGFARVEGSQGDCDWHWEIRSVNGRGLDIRLRLPSGFERLEPGLREKAQKKLIRGSLTVGLQVRRTSQSGALRVNRAALDSMLALCDELAASGRAGQPSADGLLAIKGIVEIDEEADEGDTLAALDGALMASFDDALDGLLEMRHAEGARLESIVNQRLEQIVGLKEQAEANPSRTPDAIQKRLQDLVSQLLDNAPALDAPRLYQEAVLLATKADIREELDRLSAHISAARDLLDATGAVGRKFDFLVQEFNRETNTICSKSNDVELTRVGLELKSVVDQLREQVQNIE